MNSYEKALSIFNEYEKRFQQTIAPLYTTLANENLISAFTSAFSVAQTTANVLTSSYEAMQESLLSLYPALQNAVDSLVLNPDVMENYAASFRNAYKDFLSIDISKSIENLQEALSLFAEKLSSIPDDPDFTADDTVEDTIESDASALPTEVKKHRLDITLVLTILSFFLTIHQSISSEIDSRRQEEMHQEKIGIMTEELQLMEEQRDYVASICEQLLIILDETDATPSPAPNTEPTPPTTDTAGSSVPLEADVILDDTQSSVVASDGSNKHSETD